jgi:hypothetical protein
VYPDGGEPARACRNNGAGGELRATWRQHNGVTLFSNELAGKRLEMLNQLVPQLRRVAILEE